MKRSSDLPPKALSSFLSEIPDPDFVGRPPRRTSSISCAAHFYEQIAAGFEREAQVQCADGVFGTEPKK